MQSQVISPEKLEKTITDAFSTLKGLQTERNIVTANTLTKYSDQIQQTLNSFLFSRGVVSQKQLDELDEQIREAKKKTLEAQSKNTFVKYGMIISIAFVGFGALWLITKNKTQ